MELIKIYLRDRGYDLNSKITVEKNIIEKIDKFYDWNGNDEKVIRYIESGVVEILEEKEDDGVNGVYEEELVFVKEGYDPDFYDIITFNAKFNVEGNHVEVVVESK